MKNHVLTIGDPKDEKLLRKKSSRVKNPQSTDMIILKQTMARICAQPGVAGIAAPQLGVNVRMFALSTGTGQPPIFFINPRFVGLSEETVPMNEGCLSVPHKGGTIERHTEVRLSWYDHNNKRYEYTFTGFYAEAVQHEMDHLEGTLYIDKASAVYTEEEMQQKFREAQEREAAMSPDEILAAAEADMTQPLKELEKTEDAEV